MRNIYIASLLLAGSQAYTQSVVPDNIRATHTIEKLTDINGSGQTELYVGIPMPAGKVVGTNYFDENWNTGSFLLYNQKVVENYPIRFDIEANEIDIKVKDQVKVIRGDQVKSFTWKDADLQRPLYFLNAKDFKTAEGVPFTGFLQVMSDGAMPLFKRTYVVVRKATYNMALDMGSKDDKITKKNDFYILQDGKLVKMPSSKKKLLPFFGEQAPAIDKLIKEKQLVLSNEGDLTIIFEHYNALVESKS
ncbi:MAG TPA: hypothetical protein VD816_16555 [Ohtaekwangia sp.]|nr:hypothetical protein [Ohtaekwangia sp.]